MQGRTRRGEEAILKKGVKALCPGCGKLRVIRYRGVCQICGRNKVINRPDRRKTDIWGTEGEDVDVKECQKLLLDYDTARPGCIWGMARRVVRIFGPKVQIEDLVQTAYVVLARSAKSWIRAGRPQVSLYQYARRGITAAMFALAEEEASRGIHRSLRGLFDAEDKPIKLASSLRGGLGEVIEPLVIRDLLPKEIGTVFVTQHALKRYRQRFNPSGIASDITNKLPYSHTAPSWMWRCISKKLQRADILLQYKNIVFAIIQQDLHWGSWRPVVLTVMTFHSLERRRQGLDGWNIRNKKSNTPIGMG